MRFSEEQIIDDILKKFNDKKISILAPLVRGRKGHYRELFEDIRKQGYLRVRVDGDTQEIQPKMQVDRYKIHDIEVVIDRIKVDKKEVQRLRESIGKALKEGKGLLFIENLENGKVVTYSKTLMCPTTVFLMKNHRQIHFHSIHHTALVRTAKGLASLKLQIMKKSFLMTANPS